jgi:hypothetical protein
MKRLLSVLIVSSISVGSIATTLYKTTDEQGNVSYSDSPPADTSRTSEINVSDKELNVLPSEGIEQQMREQKVKDSQDANRRRAEQQGWQQRYDQAKAELDQAKRNLQRAEEIQEGDTVGSAFGGARPNAEWIERLEQAEADLVQKQRAFDKIKRQSH